MAAPNYDRIFGLLEADRARLGRIEQVVAVRVVGHDLLHRDSFLDVVVFVRIISGTQDRIDRPRHQAGLEPRHALRLELVVVPEHECCGLVIARMRLWQSTRFRPTSSGSSSSKLSRNSSASIVSRVKPMPTNTTTTRETIMVLGVWGCLHELVRGVGVLGLPSKGWWCSFRV